MTDLLEKLVDDELYYLAEDLKMQLEKGAGTRPVLFLLSNQRQRAVKAIHGLIEANPTDHEMIRQFQQEARLYYDLMEHCREMIRRGKEADARIGELEREALAVSLEQMEPEEKRLLNVETAGED